MDDVADTSPPVFLSFLNNYSLCVWPADSDFVQMLGTGVLQTAGH